MTECKPPQNIGKKVRRLIFILFILLTLVLLIGYIGYKHFFNMNHVDALYNASITASTLGLAPDEKTEQEKIFTGMYAFLSGIFVVSIVSAIVSSIFTLYYENLL